MPWSAPKKPKAPSTMTEIDMPRMQQKAPGLGELGSLHMMASLQEGCKQKHGSGLMNANEMDCKRGRVLNVTWQKQTTAMSKR